jgi:4-hydroxy-tetrahydrodipicolinate synthase
MGGQQRPECARAHIGAIAESTELPLILFQYPISGGLGYPLDTLLRLCTEFPSIRAIKDWCNDPHLHERHIRELHALDRPVRVLSTHSMWLLGSLVLGCDGLLSGAGSVIANLQVALFQAVQRNDLQTARTINDRIYPTVRAFYSDPLLDMHNRMKEGLVLLGRLDAAHVRPPLMKLEKSEIERIGSLLSEAGITASTVYENGI